MNATNRHDQPDGNGPDAPISAASIASNRPCTDREHSGFTGPRIRPWVG